MFLQRPYHRRSAFILKYVNQIECLHAQESWNCICELDCCQTVGVAEKLVNFDETLTYKLIDIKLNKQ